MEDQVRKFDTAVLGSGPGGYVAAIRAASGGKRVALIESKDLGGVCLNWGCIPTKTLIANAEVLKKVRGASDFGIQIAGMSFDYAHMKRRKDQVVEKIRKSLEGLVQAHRIEIIRGFGEFVGPRQIKVRGQQNCLVEADSVIIATGSAPRQLASCPFDYKTIHDSSSVLELTQLPSKMVIVGGGVIGCEFASLFKELGVDIVILEALPLIIAPEGKAISDALTLALKKRGIQIQTGVTVEGIDRTDSGVRVRLGNGESIEGDMALVAVGRKLNSDGFGLERAGVFVNERGAIEVNERMETNVPGIYAIGDVTGKWLLAHVASHQGVVAAENILGEKSVMHYNAVPSVIFTHPEVATVGLTLDRALELGYDAQIGKFPFMALGKAQASLETDGFAQIVVDKKTGQILGAQVMGYEASSLIAEMTVAVQNELTVDCITASIHAHPTIAEGWLEAAWIARDLPIHLPPKAKR